MTEKKIVKFPGFPEIISDEYIEFPSDLDLLKQPMYINTPVEYIMKHGTDFQRMLIDKAPLKNHTKYVTVNCLVRVVYPGILINRNEVAHLGSPKNEWHTDYVEGTSTSNDNLTYHAIVNEDPTEFNITPFELELPDGIWNHERRRVLYDYAKDQFYLSKKELGLAPKSMPTNQFVTFVSHLHRAPVPTEKKVRFFLRINETDAPPPPDPTRWRQATSPVWSLGNESILIPNVTQSHGKVEINY